MKVELAVAPARYALVDDSETIPEDEKEG